MGRRAAVASTLVLACMIPGSHALAADGAEKDECINAADQGQQFRDDNKFRVAHDAFARCANESCPVLVKEECSQWLRDLDERMPTVVIRAEDSKHHELTDVEVMFDDAQLISKLDGTPVPVDPGDHVFHYEAAGLSPVEEHVVIRAGEKNRVLKAQFQEESTGTTEPVEHAPTAPATPSMPPATWVLGGLALAAFASEAYFGLSGLGDRSTDLGPGGCAPHCGDTEKSAIQTKFIVADVSLGVGLVSAGLAVYFFFSSRGAPAPSTAPAEAAIRFTPRPGGGIATIGGHF
jgi:hypothetical protein